jgi:hypothetical protein
MTISQWAKPGRRSKFCLQIAPLLLMSNNKMAHYAGAPLKLTSLNYVRLTDNRKTMKSVKVDDFNVGEQNAGYAKFLFCDGNTLMNL